MASRSIEQDTLYRLYQSELAEHHMARPLRSGIVLVVVLNSLFIFLDYFAYPEQVHLLVGVRMTLNLALVLLFWRVPCGNPLTLTRVSCLLTGAGMIAISGAAGGVTSQYAYALPVLLLGMPVLLQLNVPQAGMIVGPLLAGFAALPLVTDWEFVFRDYAIALFFPLASGVECVASCAVLDRLRFLDFRQRRELKQAETQIVRSARMAAVGELAAGVAHEANNPVNFAINAARALDSSLAGFHELSAKVAKLDWTDRERLTDQLAELERLHREIGAEDLDGTVSELIEIVTDGLERTAKLVGELREFAKPGGGAKAVFDLREGLESTLKLVAKTLAENDVEVDLQVAHEVPVVLGDSSALNQVFLNLLKNAAEAMEGRGGSIRVSASLESSYVCVVVRDDGPGIAPEVEARLFEPFFTTKGAGQGTGLGLSISRQIAEAHGGSLELEPSEGEGACFRLRIPVDAPGEG